ncbi:MAG: N-acetylneuraminate synthase [Anaerolineales bacterium]|nr:N-acetylneuraminate synthase [Anaerolineales bacterium]
MNAIRINDRLIGPGPPCFIIAEAGVNHNGDLNKAKQLVDVAVDAGADAVKFQTFKAENIVSASAPKAAYQRQTTDVAESQLEMLRRLELSFQAHQKLVSYCQKKGILFLSTPFDRDSVDLLDTLGVPLFKVGSGEITNLPLLAYIAQKGKPIILSTGMSHLSEVAEAIQKIYAAGNHQIVLLHCVSNYPADPADTNLRAMSTLANAFQLPVGYSDHTLGIEIAIAAAALGACVIEKHITLDKSLPGPDHQASSEPDELAALVKGVRMVESALGHGRKEPAASEENTRAVARRSLVAACTILAGTRLTEDLIAVKRPGTGLPPSAKQYLIGRIVQKEIIAGQVITLEMVM